MLWWTLWTACSGDTSETGATCLPGETTLDVTVVNQEGEPILDARVELDRQPCTELGEGLYRCTTAQTGLRDLFVLVEMEYAAFAQKIDVGAPCEPATIPVEVVLLPAMARAVRASDQPALTMR